MSKYKEYSIKVTRQDGKAFQSIVPEFCLKSVLLSLKIDITTKGSIWEFSDVKIFNEDGDDISESQWIQEMIMEEGQ